MALEKLLDRLHGLFGERKNDGSRRPDGGTSCYRPAKRKTFGEEQTGTVPAERPGQEAGAVPYIHTGFTGMNPPADYTAAPPAQQPSGPYFARPEDGRDNISYMPGVYAQEQAPVYTHVEHIMTMTSLKSCYEAIECMKNGETLIISLDAIANEGESMRCQDMLAGAAFTLNCNVRMLQGGRLVLIAPENVRILPEQPQTRMDRSPVSGMPPVTPAVPQEQAPMYTGRQRRTSQRAAQWEAARNGEAPNYNPYTGTAPVAAGEYRNFGGYGY